MTRPADNLVGREVGNGWKVESVVGKDPRGTGGRFSTGYIVGKNGIKAFLKAMDLTEALLDKDPLAAIRFFAEVIQFEGEVLTECRGRRLSRIVQLLEGGAIESNEAGVNPITAAASRVYFYIFELAEADARRSFPSPDKTSCAAKLHALHHVATAIQQLHNSGIAHQDIKPSNVVRFRDNEHKIADLGRASVLGKVAPTDGMPFPGDQYYMPPEFAYSYYPPDALDRRLGTDVYLLGSLISFLFTLQGATTLLRQALSPEHLPTIWSGGAKGWEGVYADILPHLVMAHMRVCEYVSAQIPEFCRLELANAYKELTHPDPLVRGNPKTRAMVGRLHGIERYVSLFNRLEKLAAVNERILRSATTR